MTRETAVKASNLLDAIERLGAFGLAFDDLLSEYDISIEFGNELEGLVANKIKQLKDELEAL